MSPAPRSDGTRPVSTSMPASSTHSSSPSPPPTAQNGASDATVTPTSHSTVTPTSDYTLTPTSTFTTTSVSPPPDDGDDTTTTSDSPSTTSTASPGPGDAISAIIAMLNTASVPATPLSSGSVSSNPPSETDASSPPQRGPDSSPTPQRGPENSSKLQLGTDPQPSSLPHPGPQQSETGALDIAGGETQVGADSDGPLPAPPSPPSPPSPTSTSPASPSPSPSPPPSPPPSPSPPPPPSPPPSPPPIPPTSKNPLGGLVRGVMLLLLGCVRRRRRGVVLDTVFTGRRSGESIVGGGGDVEKQMGCGGEGGGQGEGEGDVGGGEGDVGKEGDPEKQSECGGCGGCEGCGELTDTDASLSLYNPFWDPSEPSSGRTSVVGRVSPVVAGREGAGREGPGSVRSREGMGSVRSREGVGSVRSREGMGRASPVVAGREGAGNVSAVMGREGAASVRSREGASSVMGGEGAGSVMSRKRAGSASPVMGREGAGREGAGSVKSRESPWVSEAESVDGVGEAGRDESKSEAGRDESKSEAGRNESRSDVGQDTSSVCAMENGSVRSGLAGRMRHQISWCSDHSLAPRASRYSPLPCSRLSERGGSRSDAGWDRSRSDMGRSESRSGAGWNEADVDGAENGSVRSNAARRVRHQISWCSDHSFGPRASRYSPALRSRLSETQVWGASIEDEAPPDSLTSTRSLRSVSPNLPRFASFTTPSPEPVFRLPNAHIGLEEDVGRASPDSGTVESEMLLEAPSPELPGVGYGRQEVYMRAGVGGGLGVTPSSPSAASFGGRSMKSGVSEGERSYTESWRGPNLENLVNHARRQAQQRN